MGKSHFKYYREDFGELPVTLHHLTITLTFFDAFVEASNCLEMTARWPLSEISLDANSLEVLGIEWCSSPKVRPGQGELLECDYQMERNKLVVKLPKTVGAGECFFVRTSSRCFPSDHLLEGIYLDVTPPGAPQQFMSQCQQWGFQRIMPIFDDCRAKCSMTTTLEADSRYTHLISNGNVNRRMNPDGLPVPKPGEPGRQVITYENHVPMPPYLFIACAGTWDSLVDEVTYASGRKVRLEYLVPMGFTEQVRVPMAILKQSIFWIAERQGYEYTGDTYRTICMSKSNFGGMENAGNTTIVTDAALVTEHTLDTGLLYAHAVIVHEFEHNQCGSETTMDTPFDIWLNEAYTVDVERQFMAEFFDPVFVRLNQVDSIRNPLLGPLAIEDAGHIGRIVREGFNEPDELIDGVTYVKAAEVVRMLRLIIGLEAFKAGKSLYFTRYRNGNANTDQFFACFEEASGQSLEQFKQEWLYRIGYPRVTSTSDYDPLARQYRIRFRQELREGERPFHLPIALSVVDKTGKDISGTTRVYQLMDREGELTFDGIAEPPAFASLNRDASFYGTFQCEGVEADTLNVQALLDPNFYNRVEAMRRLTDRERIRLMLDPAAEVTTTWLELYGRLIADQALPLSVKAFILRIDEQPLERVYCTWHEELVSARERLMKAVNQAYRAELVEQFRMLDTYTVLRDASLRYGIEHRLLKSVLLDLISIDDTADSHELILTHFRVATTATDRVAALLALNRSSSPARRAVLEEVYDAWHGHLSGYANYLRIVSSGTCDDVFEMVEVEKQRPTFDINQPTWSRALFLPMAMNTKKVWTDEGIRWVAGRVIELGPFNMTTAGRLLNTFQHVRSLKPHLRKRVTAALERIVSEVPEDVSPSINGQAAAYLRG